MTEPADVLSVIRDHELRATQEVEAARAHAETSISEARAEARRIVELGRKRGRRTAAERYQTRIEGAGTEAEAIVGDVEALIRRLQDSVEPRLSRAVDEMVALLLSPPGDEGG